MLGDVDPVVVGVVISQRDALLSPNLAGRNKLFHMWRCMHNI